MGDPTPDIKRFLAWMENHGNEEAVVKSGILQSSGCTPLPELPDPGCCSDHVDLQDLAESLRSLIGEDKK